MKALVIAFGIGLVLLVFLGNEEPVPFRSSNPPSSIPIPPRIQGGQLYFKGDPCTIDCSGHEAGYAWAEENGIDDPDDCEGNSESFIEGCRSYAEEQSESVDK